jgi:glycerol-1-phosphate dehydrogenase [NAD(P)+]
MLLSPLFIDIRAGAVSGLGELLADRRISADGHVAVAVGPGQGEQIVEALGPALKNADIFTVEGGSLEAAGVLQDQVRGREYDALVGIGGGRTLDVAKYAATRLGLPMVAVATNLAHDGIASPVASLLHKERKGSFAAGLPIAVVVDLDYVRASPPRMVRSGIGDLISNLTAIEDWWLAHDVRGEPVDGLAVTFARTAAEAVIHRVDGIEADAFLGSLAEGLVLSGMAMAAAGSSRPASGADHEIMHAIDQLFPGTANHGELAGVGTLFSAWLRGNADLAARVDTCLRQHGLPRTPADIDLTVEQFAQAVELAPSTRPDRYTILEHLDLDAAAIRAKVDAYVEAYG